MYITWKAKRYIVKAAEKQGIVLKEDSFGVLRKYYVLAKERGYRLLFCRMRAHDKDAETCNAYFGCFPIHISQAYAAKLVLNNTEEVQNAFLMSLGHEMTHKDNDMGAWLGISAENGVKFIAHTNEVHADFGAAQKLANSNRTKLLKAVNYKLSYKKNTNVSDFHHPSWNQRRDYIQNFDFNENLIRQIAADVDCTNEKLIQKAINHFEEIYLN